MKIENEYIVILINTFHYMTENFAYSTYLDNKQLFLKGKKYD